MVSLLAHFLYIVGTHSISGKELIIHSLGLLLKAPMEQWYQKHVLREALPFTCPVSQQDPSFPALEKEEVVNLLPEEGAS